MAHAEEKKRSNEEWKWLSSAESDTPISPTEKCKYDYHSEGWKYYLLIKLDLQDWWDEFNGKLDKKGKVFYKTLDQFIKHKTHNPRQRKWLQEMMGPIPEQFGKKRLPVPWLGDWYRRRKNGSWSIDNKIQLKGLRKAIERQSDSMEAIKACAPFLVQEMLQYTRLTEKINSVFGNEPFLDEAPTSRNNKIRFRTYMNMLGKVTGMKMRLIQEWMRVNGIDPRNPHEMWDMTTLAQLSGSLGAAGAITGFTAGMNVPQLGSPMSPFNTQPQYTKDTILLAGHLTEHARIFKKPLKSLDNDVVDVKTVSSKVDKKDKANGKSNGKHSTQ